MWACLGLRNCFITPSWVICCNHFMEETCDSEALWDSGGDCFLSDRFNELDRLFIADDAQSTTSNTSCMEDLDEKEYKCREFGDPIPQNYIQYLAKASDDELGLPPNLDGFADEMLQGNDMDLDFDVERSERKVDDSHFWLSLLQG
ncbi:hypothetical protein SUGI_0937250 [Cryptomeria japonica]|uniref:uncharacterized protein LOC131080029 n=1 Tax=Cryptomeria japonica TaxID=3369 RepID=UPI002414A574|nr:uncharacterized protein LOC131080029 [Cryptomeria japonica]GLJ44594.1 hypothetical protein SUGI_0937250 [Cryptomeria japonica]